MLMICKKPSRKERNNNMQFIKQGLENSCKQKIVEPFLVLYYHWTI